MTATNHVSDQDSQDLARLGYKQELARTLGAFSAFCTGFAFISILTGIFLLFGFAFATGGAVSWWAWVIAGVGQMLFALSFAELAVKYPLAGSVYNWSKRVARPATAWMSGAILTVALVVSTAGVPLALNAVLPAVSDFFVFSDDPVKNSVILGIIMIVLMTLVNVSNTKVMSLINNIGVSIELVGAVVLILGFLFRSKRGPQVVFDSNGTVDSTSGGLLGVLLVSVLLGLYVMWGFDTAGSVSEETINPRKTNPKAIIRAVAASAVLGALLLITAFMAAKDLRSEELASGGVAYLVLDVFGSAFGKILLVCIAIAIFVCGMANQIGAARMMFAMARDNALPGSNALSKVSPRSQQPTLPILIVAVVSIVILLVNISQTKLIVVLTGVTVILALLAYCLVVGPFTLSRHRGEWGQAEAGYFSLGAKGKLVSGAAFVWAVVMIVNVAWPRKNVYNPESTFLLWGGVIIPVIVVVLCGLVYAMQAKKIGVRSEHAAAARS